MNIVITSPIPEGGVGGPASVMSHIQAECIRLGDRVELVAPTRTEMRLPSVLRQWVLFVRLFGPIARTDTVLVLDPVSTGFPAAIVASIVRKPVVLRVGGDFLWESFVERTKEPVLLSEFYTKPRTRTMRERMIFFMTKATVSRATLVVFTTNWQRELWSVPYGIPVGKTAVVANALPAPEHALETGKELLALGRDTTVKNIALLQRVWDRVAHNYPTVTLRTGSIPANEYGLALSRCLGVIQPSISEVSPNTILEAIAYGKPFITTADTGIREQYHASGLFIDTRDEAALEQAIASLVRGSATAAQSTDTRTWKEAGREWRAVLAQVVTTSV
jgi:hypothetical protein